MAVTLTVTPISRVGVNLSGMTAADATGNKWVGSGTEFAVIKNGSGASINVTEVITGAVDAQVPAGRVVAVPAGATMIMGSYPGSAYQDASNFVNLTFSAVASVTIGVYSFN